MNLNSKHTRLAEVCELIDARMGLHFPIEKWDMFVRNLLQAAGAFGFDRFDESIEWLLTTKLDPDQIKILATFLTISETYFWREEAVFSALTDNILPALVASKKIGEKKIRIWSAGCSSGEEPYSLAIALHRAIPNLKEWNIQILATDMNPKALEKAEKGIYTQWSFRNCPPWLKNNYFSDLGEGKFKIIPTIRKMVTFSNLNLAEDEYPSITNNTNSFDIIFCRNVLMYFTDEWISKISQNLYHSLNPDGWFVVASCELSSERFPQFKTVDFTGAILYQKGMLEFIPILSKSITEPELIPEAVSTIPDTSAISKKIRLQANKGDLSQALILCNEGIESDKLSAGLYFLRSAILQELDKPIDAVASIKQAIYLDPDFIMGHFVLGNLSHQEGNFKQAKKYFNNVLDLLKAYYPDDILPESEGLSAKYMHEIILATMQKIPLE